MAWLQAVPNDTELEQNAKNKKFKKNTSTRFQRLFPSEESREYFQMPDLLDGFYIVNYLNTVGPAISNGMGIVPITWAELYSWIQCSQYVVSPYECDLLIKLSQAYTSEFNQASDPRRPAPYVITEALPSKQEVDNKLKNFFGQFKKIKGTK